MLFYSNWGTVNDTFGWECIQANSPLLHLLYLQPYFDARSSPLNGYTQSRMSIFYYILEADSQTASFVLLAIRG